MNILLDTHTFLWLSGESEKLSRTVQQAIIDAETIAISVASIWEIQIKNALGKLPLNESLEKLIQQECAVNAIQILPITDADVYTLHQLPHLHADPFDRMLIAQTLRQGLTIATKDTKIALYNVPILW